MQAFHWLGQQHDDYASIRTGIKLMFLNDQNVSCLEEEIGYVYKWSPVSHACRRPRPQMLPLMDLNKCKLYEPPPSCYFSEKLL
ncbi:MAG: hypothetical protein ACI81P_002147 [Neolewinella sp.]|jgi:hypothetical protein